MLSWRSSCLGVLAATLLAGAPVHAQATAAASWSASPAAQLKASLKALAAAQSRYREQRGSYAPALSGLGPRAEPGVRLEVTAASPSGWQGRALHQSRPGLSCVIFVGGIAGREAPRTEGDGEMAGEDGVPLCDRMR